MIPFGAFSPASVQFSLKETLSMIVFYLQLLLSDWTMKSTLNKTKEGSDIIRYQCQVGWS